MKQSSIGFGFCVIGCLLYVINYVAAVSVLSRITSWPTAAGKLSGAYDEVGRQPTLLGAVLFVIGLFLVIKAMRKQ